MKNCPKCGKESVRASVNLFLDIPGEFINNLSKTALKSKDVRIMGAGWDRATYYCTNSKCGWLMLIKSTKEKVNDVNV